MAWSEGAGWQSAAVPTAEKPEWVATAVLLAWRLGRRLWSYREVCLVFFVAPFVVATLLRLWLVLPLGSSALLALMVVPKWRRWVMSWMEDARRRHYLHRMRRDWAAVCRSLGWSKEVGRDGAGQHRMILATLRRADIEDDGQVLVVEVKPLPSQPRSTWGVMTDQFRRYVGVPVARWDEPAPGVLRMRLARQPLPAQIAFPRDRAPTSWTDLRIGVGAGGGEVVWRPIDVPHLLDAGVTKGGKGSVLRNMAYDALLSGWVVHVINPKLSGEYRWLELVGVPVLETLEACCDLLEWVEVERARRQELVKAAGCGSWEQVSGWVDAPLLLIIDEVSALLMIDKANKATAKYQERMSYLVTRLVQLGRSAGVHLVLATQRPDVSSLGPNGGILRDNIDGRVGVCSLQDAGLAMMFGSGLDPDIKSTLDGTKGRGLATMLCAGDFDVYPLQVYWLDERELMASPPRPLSPQGGERVV